VLDARIFLGLAGLIFCSSSVLAQWEVEPRLRVSETYTDNVDLDRSGEEDSALITEVAPGISFHREGARASVDVNYELQSVLILSDDNSQRVNHRLGALGQSELIEDFFFFDASSSIRQVVIDERDAVSSDNVTGDNNRSDVYTVGFSPWVQNRFGGYASGRARYRYDKVWVGEGASDSQNHLYLAELNSGPRMLPWGWLARYSRDEQDNSDDREDTTFESAFGQLSWRLTPSLTALAQGGWENNDFRTDVQEENGYYWAGGGTWTPSRRFSVTGLTGSDYQTASVFLAPSQRTSMDVTYRDRDVGLNPGETWTASVRHYTRRTTLQATYFEDTQTTQRLLARGLDTPLYVNPQLGIVAPIVETDFGRGALISQGEVAPGVVQFSLIPEQALEEEFIVTETFSLTDDSFERKRGSLQGTFSTGKSRFLVRGYREERQYLGDVVDRGDETNTGVIGGWRWEVAGRTTALTRLSWIHSEYDIDDRDDDTWLFETEVERRIARDMTGSVGYRYTQRDSDDSDAEYRENRLFGRLLVRF
jgi:uncharacterized protein (PEP-CTERM system associated)